MDLYLSEYRHVAIGFARTLKATSVPEDVLEMLLDYQAGHSSATAKKCYAVSDENMARLSSDSVEKHLAASTLWWKFVGLCDETSDTGIRDTTLVDDRIKVLGDEVKSMLKVFESQQDILHDVLQLVKGGHQKDLDSRMDIESLPADKIWQARWLLRQYLKNPTAEFLSPWQGYAVAFTLGGNGNGLVVLPTGGGKTLVAELYAYNFPQKVSFIFLPTTGLYDDMVKRFERTPLSFSTWRKWSQEPLHRYPSIFICMIDDLMSNCFFTFMDTLKNDGRIGSIFIDEIHLAIEWSTFRTPVHMLPKLNAFNVPVIGLTATLRKNETNKLGSILATFIVVRHPNTLRSDINYNVLNYGNLGANYIGSLFGKLRVLAQQCLSTLLDSERMIILVMSKSEVNAITSMLNPHAIAHDSSLENDIKSTNLDEWKSGNYSILVGTTGISVGIHYSRVKYVIAFGLCYSVMELVQVSGRAARENNITGTFNLVTCNEYMERVAQMDGGKNDDIKEIIQFTREGICRRNFLSTIVDECPLYCSESNACDTCKKLFDGDYKRFEISSLKRAQTDEGGPLTKYIRSKSHSYDIRVLEMLKSIIRLLSENCGMCLTVKGALEKHEPFKCSYLYGTCLRCLSSSHSLKNCEFNIKSDTRVSLFCFGCLLPFTVDRHQIHPVSVNYSVNQCPIRDNAKIIAWIMYRTTKGRAILFTIPNVPTSEKEYCEWLGVTNYPLSNMGVVLLKWYNEVFRKSIT
jgi:superfamily II DNA helicase RecQ